MPDNYIAIEYDRSHLLNSTSFAYSLMASSIDIYDVIIIFVNVIAMLLITVNYLSTFALT